MNKSLTISDSLIGSLCREIEYIRHRYKTVTISLQNSKDKILRERLLNEIISLKQRRLELIDISEQFRSKFQSSISKLFLYELCNRPL
ncbi:MULTISPECIES: hypothetical protein [unclassified Prochlorococcus]|uniref:hypothetical protein n=1 Tax=unclassified Prochlorococcus TaxID=2627481 RepID=UPI0005338663|nr:MULTISPECIES: hypothetical protein [unclassified Prochlorococcus]KGG15201.1 hypothetical protein EV06_1069 [Prochlorococcus sp. MIT 0602]KGG17475.1 hypothetical protein EV07_0915 [Prochlorococcus sp. MIT 0603]